MDVSETSFLRKTGELSLKNVTQSLKRIRRESWLAQVEVRTKLSPSQYWTKVRMIRKTSKIVRTSEKVRFKKKQEWLKLKENDCENHYICSWMKEVRYDIKSRLKKKQEWLKIRLLR